MRFAIAAPTLALSLVACGSMQPDAPATRAPDLHLRDVQDPSSPNYSPNRDVSVTAEAVVWVDDFDETRDGKSKGTVYVQDVTSQNPYSGIGLFQPSYIPNSLSPVPGDVLNFVGPYQEVTSIGTAKFPAGETLPQLAKPVGTFSYEYQAPPPTVVQLGDLNDYKKGRKWEGMLVTVQDVYVSGAAVDSSGRVTYSVLPGASAPQVANNVAISNELYDLKKTDFKAGTHFKSVTGIATWFFSYHIAPRSPADLVQQ